MWLYHFIAFSSQFQIVMSDLILLPFSFSPKPFLLVLLVLIVFLVAHTNYFSPLLHQSRSSFPFHQLLWLKRGACLQEAGGFS